MTRTLHADHPPCSLLERGACGSTRIRGNPRSCGSTWKSADANARLVAEAEARDQVEAQLRHIQKMERVGQLTGDFAHDFNNRLAIVIGSLDMPRRRRSGAGDDKAQRYCDNARERAQTAAMLTERLLAFARLQPLEPKVLDANRLVGSMSELFHRTVSETIRTETVLAAGAWRSCADAPQLETPSSTSPSMPSTQFHRVATPALTWPGRQPSAWLSPGARWH